MTDAKSARPKGTTVTVVVPTRNSARTIEPCLRSLRSQTLACRVVVVDNASSDKTLELARSYADLILNGGPERSAQRNCGALAAPAAVVGFIDSDMVVGPSVVEQAVSSVNAGSGAVIVPERTTGVGFWARVRAFERAFYEGSDAIEAARFFRWDVFQRLGGFDEEMTGTEDWDLTVRARTFTSIGRTVAMIDHDEGVLDYLGACRRKAYYAPGIRTYSRKHGVQILLTAANRPYLRRPWKLVCPLGMGLVALKVGETVAVAGALMSQAHRRVPLGATESLGKREEATPPILKSPPAPRKGGRSIRERERT